VRFLLHNWHFAITVKVTDRVGFTKKSPSTRSFKRWVFDCIRELLRYATHAQSKLSHPFTIEFATIMYTHWRCAYRLTVLMKGACALMNTSGYIFNFLKIFLFGPFRPIFPKNFGTAKRIQIWPNHVEICHNCRLVEYLRKVFPSCPKPLGSCLAKSKTA